MTRERKILKIWGLALLAQLFVFSDYIAPFQWGRLKVSGLACTCPDESVLGGRLYLRSITPDSLKEYNLDFSEVYVTKRPFTDVDLMGVDLYMIEGEVIGKDRVSAADPWNPVFRVDRWREVNIFMDWGIKGVFFIQLFVWLILLEQVRSKNGKQAKTNSVMVY